MAKGKKGRRKEIVRKNEVDKKEKSEENDSKCRKLDEKCATAASQFFKSDELQEIRAILGIHDVVMKGFNLNSDLEVQLF